jgi:hypothetical protein
MLSILKEKFCPANNDIHNPDQCEANTQSGTKNFIEFKNMFLSQEKRIITSEQNVRNFILGTIK